MVGPTSAWGAEGHMECPWAPAHYLQIPQFTDGTEAHGIYSSSHKFLWPGPQQESRASGFQT